MTYESFGAFPSKIEREQLFNAFKKVIEKGVTDPADIDESDPDGREAEELYRAWLKQKDEEENADPSKAARINFEKNFIHLDVGFTDPSYANEVLNDWAQQDLHNAEESDPVLAQEMREKIEMYRQKLLPGEKEE